jgi:DNA polymerase III epsilon subunit-like protein
VKELLASQAAITVIDFETTGSVEDYPDEAWQIGMVFFQGGTLRAQYQFTSLLRVGDRPFNHYAPGRHAQLRQEIASAPTLQELWPTLKHWLPGRILAAHNIGTEKKFIEGAFPLHALGPWVDTLKLARIAFPECRSHKLEDLTEELGLRSKVDSLCPGLEAHDAFYDAVACAALLEYLLQLPGWDGLSVEALLQGKADAYRRLRKTGAKR